MQNTYPLEKLFGRVLSPFERFLRRTTAGGIVLVATTALALSLATFLGAERLHHFWDQPFALAFADRFEFSLSLHHWVNDALMALFFLVVGLELKREMLVGELASLRDAALPVVAAIGGMVVPALIYAGFNAGRPTISGWGIPMATDIAFAIGVLVLLSWRIPKNLAVFLTALAIADDLGAVLVIALFYTAQIDFGWLATAAALAAVLVLFNRGGVRRPLPYALVGIVLWYAVHASGVHATVASIVLAFAIPARSKRTAEQFAARVDELRVEFDADRRDQTTTDDPLGNRRMAAIAESMERTAAALQSPLERIEHRLAPWVTFVVIPIFALANAGIDLSSVRWSEAFASRVTLGIFFGLVVGKLVGIGAFSWLAVRLGWARLPAGVAWKHIVGAACLAGIGFTMSIFIGQLAFKDEALIDEAKLGILLASAVAALAGLAWLAVSAPERAARVTSNPAG